jgi:hypothetical protein
MRLLKTTAMACSLLAIAEGAAWAQTAGASAQASGNAQLGGSGAGTFFDNYSIRLGFQSGGPLLFRDTQDGRVEQTSVFQFGPRVAFLFGNEVRDVHRAGIGFAYLPTARSDSRHLRFIPIYLMYETGHPLVLQATMGANIATGTAGFSNYGGVHTGVALRYSFLSESRWSPVTVSPGIVANANVSTSNMQYSSAFLGAQIDVSYNTAN